MTGSFPLFFSEFQKYLVVFFLTRKSNEFRRNASSFSFRVQHVDCYLKMWGTRAAHVQFPGSMTCKLYLHGLHVAFPETLTCLPPLFSPRFGPQNQFLLCWPAALKRVFSKLPTQIPSENSPKRGKSCRSSPKPEALVHVYDISMQHEYSLCVIFSTSFLRSCWPEIVTILTVVRQSMMTVESPFRRTKTMKNAITLYVTYSTN